MHSSLVFTLALIGVGTSLLVWGITASDSLSSQTSELFQGAPSNKAIALMVIGGLVGGFGLLRLFRRAAA